MEFGIIVALTLVANRLSRHLNPKPLPTTLAEIDTPMNTSTSPSALQTALRGEQPPLLIDARRGAAFVGGTDMIRGALRRDPESVTTWAATLPAASRVVVYCVHGREVSQSTAAALRASGIAASYLEGGIEAWKSVDGSLIRKPANSPTRWITRERPKIDRIACPWLIARFIDADAEFVYVPALDVLRAGTERDAIAYDIPGAEFSHEGELCSFDAFMKQYRLTDPALTRLASIVRGADTSRLDLTPQSPGLYAISLGLSYNFVDDQEMLRHGLVVYDALYAWCKSCQAETHNWPPKIG